MPNDDIVTRLEAEHWCDADDCNLAQLAADEIKRLRAAMRLMACAYKADTGFWPTVDETCASFYDEVVRGE